MLGREASSTSNLIPALVVEPAIDMTLRKPHIQLLLACLFQLRQIGTSYVRLAK